MDEGRLNTLVVEGPWSDLANQKSGIMGRQLVPTQTRLGFRFPRGVKVNVKVNVRIRAHRKVYLENKLPL